MNARRSVTSTFVLQRFSFCADI